MIEFAISLVLFKLWWLVARFRNKVIIIFLFLVLIWILILIIFEFLFKEIFRILGFIALRFWCIINLWIFQSILVLNQFFVCWWNVLFSIILILINVKFYLSIWFLILIVLWLRSYSSSFNSFSFCVMIFFTFFIHFCNIRRLAFWNWRSFSFILVLFLLFIKIKIFLLIHFLTIFCLRSFLLNVFLILLLSYNLSILLFLVTLSSIHLFSCSWFIAPLPSLFFPCFFFPWLPNRFFNDIIWFFIIFSWRLHFNIFLLIPFPNTTFVLLFEFANILFTVSTVNWFGHISHLEGFCANVFSKTWCWC